MKEIIATIQETANFLRDHLYVDRAENLENIISALDALQFSEIKKALDRCSGLLDSIDR